MRTRDFAVLAGTALMSLALAETGHADPFFFSTGNVDGRIATASRPGGVSGPNQETESADDFILSSPTRLDSAKFTGLLPSGSSVSQVVVEFYRVFPKDSTVPPSGKVPTRVNSPSDVEFVGRDSSISGELSYTTALLNPVFSVPNSVDQSVHVAGGDGPASGQEVEFSINFTNPVTLPPDHYFFVPQVLLSNADEHFLWLSSVRPIVAPGTPFPPGATDLQSWMRNEDLAPDWLRIGTDIIGGTTFNAAFTLTGETVAAVPEPASLGLLGLAIPALIAGRRRRAA